MRLRQATIASDDLPDAFRGQFPGLPDGARVADVIPNADGSLTVRFEHDSFDEVPDDGAVPDLEGDDEDFEDLDADADPNAAARTSFDPNFNPPK